MCILNLNYWQGSYGNERKQCASLIAILSRKQASRCHGVDLYFDGAPASWKLDSDMKIADLCGTLVRFTVLTIMVL